MSPLSSHDPLEPHHTPSRSPVLQPHSHTRRSPRLSPILTHHPQSPRVDPNQPQFAELLTPLRLRRRRNRGLQPDQQPNSLPPVAGPSRLGYYTLEGDLFRGALRDPTVPFHHFVEEDVVSLSTGSTSSSSSNWSWGSGNFERARAVIGRVGEALGVRRGSASSGSDTSDTDDGDEYDLRSTSSAGAKKKRKRRMSHSHRLNRTLTNLSRQTSASPERPRRQHLPKKREFTLLLPPKQDEVDLGVRTSTSSSEREAITLVEGDWSPTFGKTKDYPPDRVVITPSLPIVLEQIRSLRLARGYIPVDGTPPQTPGVTPNISVRRGGSVPGRTRSSKGSASFINPPLPGRPPAASRTQSRLHALRGDTAGDSIKPKSVSDFLGLPSPKSTSSLVSMKSEFVMPTRPTMPAMVRSDTEGKLKDKQKGCWWLDVSCPGWEDLRDIGELLGLHPLTLEDVLQQDPREKLDTFDKLGYYFLAVRALDESYFKYTPGSANSSGATLVQPHHRFRRKESMLESEKGEDDPEMEHKKEGRRRGWGMGRATGKMASKSGERVEIIEDRPGKEGLEGVGVGALNVYLVVFADGIVSFHFEDISKHTQKVLERVLTLANPDHGADWIAHGLLDSIVDAFFPLIRYVDGEVDDIDSLTIDPSTDPKKTTAFLEKININVPDSPPSIDFEMNEKAFSEKPGLTTLWRTPKEKGKRPSLVKRLRANFPNAKLYMPRPLVYVRLFFLPTSSAVRRKHEQAPEAVFDRSTMLKRITDMRRLVTGLTRLLGAKGAVINRLRKRAMEEAGTVEAYIGDVEDHILLLQTSLYHYEYILGHCQPAYLSHLNVSFSYARGGTDQAILALSVVAFSVLPMQFILGLFSMNVHVPQNGVAGSHLHEEPDGSQSPFGYFGGIVIAIFLVACGMVMIIRYWRWLARKKWGRTRGVDIPQFWEAFWGWS
ncbi:hypothetical protein IAR55_001936 [Kwoniella newhampshirensis]|uniref:Cation transporter n=1 Tax=Kwoniella newhampshirensis TaxID=1651941 RepID=A0AAW0Z3F2_9TREE